MKKIFLLALFLLWVFLTFDYIRRSDLGFFTLGERFPIGKLTGLKSDKPLGGRVARGEFHSRFPNLTAVTIRFGSLDRTDDNRLTFRLREADHEWINEAVYEISQLRQDGFYRFRFPTIVNSIDRNYQFEIESVGNLAEKAVSLGSTPPTSIVEYSFAEDELSDYRTLFYFLPRKLLNLVEDQTFLTIFFAYSLPFVVYFLFLLFGGGYIIPSFLAFFIIWWDILFIRGSYDFLFIAIIFAWLLPVVKFKIESRVSLSLAVFFLWATLIFLLSDRETWSDKTMVWLFLFLFFFSFQRFFELKMKNVTAMVSVSNFWRGLVVSIYDSLKFIYLMMKGNYRAASVMLNYLISKSGTASLQASERAVVVTLDYFPKLTSMSLQTAERLLQKVGVCFRIVLISIIRIIPFLLLWQVIIKLEGYLRAYRDFYPSLQEELFLKQTGIFLIILCLSAVVLFIFLSKKCRYVRTSIIADIIIFAVIQISGVIFDKTTDFNEVVIWKVRVNDTAEPWVDAFIDGRNLNNLPFAGKVLVNGVEHRIIDWSDKEIIFRTDPLTTANGSLEVVTSDGKKSNQLDFKYYGNR